MVVRGLIEKLYDSIHSHYVWPEDLVKNAKLENYEYVKFFHSKEGLMAEVRVMDEKFGSITFIYYFDEKDYLQRIELIEAKEPQVLFDRQKKMLAAISEISTTKNLPKKDKVAV